MKSKYILILALIMAIVTTVLFRQYLQQLDKKYRDSQNLVEVVVAKQDIKKNQKVVQDNLEYKFVNAESVLPEAIKKPSDIVGSYAITDIKAGETLLSIRFTNQIQEKELITRKIKEGYRAVAIEANYVESVSNLIQPEDYVDITFSEKSGSGIATQTLLENVRVLAVGKRIIPKENMTQEQASAPQQNQGQAEYSSVTVELKPEDIVKLVNADEKGDIKFVLRSKMSPN
jgi:pilus assembly protein CpaB